MTEILVLLFLILIAVGQLKPFRMNRATLALVGGGILLTLGAISPSQAGAALDLNTMALLFSMMVFTANLRLAGFFRWMGNRLGGLAQSPRQLLAVVMGAAALFSAFFINDTVCVMFTPLVLDLAIALELNPLPFLVGLALASNIGSMTTLIGNPQNILIGSYSGLSFGAFSLSLLVPALISLTTTYGLLALVYRKSLKPHPWKLQGIAAIPVYRPLLIKCGLSFGLMVTGLVLGWNLTVSALSGVSLLLITRRIRPERVFREVDWSLLVFFAGLFILTRTLELSSGFQIVLQQASPFFTQNLGWFAGLALMLSNLISNVPAVMVLKPLVIGFPDSATTWTLLAAVSTLAGNLTLMGSVANLIVAESAARRGIRLKFGEYLKVGLPSALLSVAATTLWLLLFPVR